MAVKSCLELKLIAGAPNMMRHIRVGFDGSLELAHMYMGAFKIKVSGEISSADQVKIKAKPAIQQIQQ